MVLELIPRTTVFTEINHPYPTVVLHAVLKGIQGGLILGFVVGNVVALYKKLKKRGENKQYSYKKVVRYMGKGMVVGVIFVTSMTLFKMVRSDLKTNQSRAFRLKISKNQNIIDNVTIGSMLAGQVALKNYQDVEFGGGYIGAFVGLLLVNIFFMLKN